MSSIITHRLTEPGVFNQSPVLGFLRSPHQGGLYTQVAIATYVTRVIYVVTTLIWRGCERKGRGTIYEFRSIDRLAASAQMEANSGGRVNLNWKSQGNLSGDGELHLSEHELARLEQDGLVI